MADWTNRNDAITKLLDANGRSGVPLYLYYAPGADKPVILPQILTEVRRARPRGSSSFGVLACRLHFLFGAFTSGVAVAASLSRPPARR